MYYVITLSIVFHSLCNIKPEIRRKININKKKPLNKQTMNGINTVSILESSSVIAMQYKKFLLFVFIFTMTAGTGVVKMQTTKQ